MCLCRWPIVAAAALALLSAAGCNEQRPSGASKLSNATTRPYLVALLVTENYEVTIRVNCAEGDVMCSDVVYHGVSRKSGKSITLKGSTYHTSSEDGTPSRFLGYRFEEGDKQYVVLEEGRLQITRGRREVLVDEVGVWRE